MDRRWKHPSRPRCRPQGGLGGGAPCPGSTSLPTLLLPPWCRQWLSPGHRCTCSALVSWDSFLWQWAGQRAFDARSAARWWSGMAVFAGAVAVRLGPRQDLLALSFMVVVSPVLLRGGGVWLDGDVRRASSLRCLQARLGLSLWLSVRHPQVRALWAQDLHCVCDLVGSSCRGSPGSGAVVPGRVLDGDSDALWFAGVCRATLPWGRRLGRVVEAPQLLRCGSRGWSWCSGRLFQLWPPEVVRCCCLFPRPLAYSGCRVVALQMEVMVVTCSICRGHRCWAPIVLLSATEDALMFVLVSLVVLYVAAMVEVVVVASPFLLLV